MPYDFTGTGTGSRGGGAYTYVAGRGWVPTAEYEQSRRAPAGAGAVGGDAGGGGYAEDVARMYDERVAEVMGRIPGTELRDVSQAGLLDVLREGPYGDFRPFAPGGLEEPVETGEDPREQDIFATAGPAGGYSPEEVAFQSYWPEMESRLYGSLSRKGFTGGGAPSAAIASGAAEFAAPLAIEHARGQERRRNKYVQDLFSAMGTSISGAQTAGQMPWPDWMRATEAEGAAEGAGGTVTRPGFTIRGPRGTKGSETNPYVPGQYY